MNDGKLMPMYSSHGHGRKTHIATFDGSLCKIELRYPGLLWTYGESYCNIEEQFFIDSEGYGCRNCGHSYRKRQHERLP